MNPILEQISNIGIVPVIAIDDAKKAVPLAKALVAGGLPVAEVTFRTAAAEEAMRSITREVPEMLVGAGTVLNREQVDRALDAGAKFIVSPGFNPDTVRYVLSKGALMVPGTATPGEMEQAMSLGLDVVKFFPAEQNGGVAKLKAIAGPYKTLKWMPTGGVNAKNLMDYLSFDQIVACGGTWMVKKDLIAAENWDEITRMTREAVRTMLGFSLHHVGVNCGSEEEADRLARTLYVSDGQLLRTGPACGGVHQDSRPRRPRSYRHRHQQRGPGGLSPGPSGHPVPGGDPQDRRQGQDEGHLCGRRVRRVCHSSGAGVKRAERLF